MYLSSIRSHIVKTEDKVIRNLKDGKYLAVLGEGDKYGSDF